MTSGWLLFVLVMVVQSLGLTRAALLVTADPVAHALGLGENQLGLLFGLAVAGPFIVAAPLWGWLADRVSRRALLAVATLAWGAAAVVAAFAGDFATLLVSRGLMGAASAAFFPLAIGLITDAHAPERHGRALGLLYAGIGVSPGIAAAALGTVYGWVEARPSITFGGALPAPWRVTFAVAAVFAVPVALLLATVRPPIRRTLPNQWVHAAAERQTPVRQALSLPVLATMFGMVVLLSVIDESNLAWLATAYTREFGYTQAQAGWTLGVIAVLAGGLGPIAGGMVADRLYRRHGEPGRLAAAAGACACLVPLLTGYVARDARAATVALTLASTFLTAALTIGMVVLQEALPDRIRGVATGLIFSLLTLLASAGPTLIAWAAGSAPSIGGLRQALTWITVPLAIAATLLASVAWARARRRPTRAVAPIVDPTVGPPQTAPEP